MIESFKSSTSERLEQIEKRTMFSGHMDKLEEKCPGIRERLERAADEISDEALDEYSAVLTEEQREAAFKDVLESMLVWYLSGFNRDESELMSKFLISREDRTIVDLVIAKADMFLSQDEQLQAVVFGGEGSEPESVEEDETLAGEDVSRSEGKIELNEEEKWQEYFRDNGRSEEIATVEQFESAVRWLEDEQGVPREDAIRAVSLLSTVDEFAQNDLIRLLTVEGAEQEGDRMKKETENARVSAWVLHSKSGVKSGTSVWTKHSTGEVGKPGEVWPRQSKEVDGSGEEGTDTAPVKGMRPPGPAGSSGQEVEYWKQWREKRETQEKEGERERNEKNKMLEELGRWVSAQEINSLEDFNAVVRVLEDEGGLTHEEAVNMAFLVCRDRIPESVRERIVAGSREGRGADQSKNEPRGMTR